MPSPATASSTASTTPTPAVAKLGHVPALDGLRALAIAGVIVTHSGWFAAGGWNGVTLFFVLSGFLITTLLLEERDRTGSVALTQFYLRRVARLYPGLLVGVAVGLVLAFAVHVPARYAIGGAVATLFYSMNVLQWLAGVPQWVFFGWSWSLSLEEQFYFLWPPLVRKIDIRRHRGRVVTVLALIAIASTVARILIAPHNLDLAYHAPFTKLDGLIAGVILALYPSVRGVSQWWGWLGLLGALVMYRIGNNGAAAWISYGEVVFIGFALLMLAAASGQQRNAYTRLLGWRPIVFIGRISYALYIWHDILVEYTLGVHFVSHRDRVVVTLGAIVIASASTLLLEEPMRRRIRSRFATRSH